MTFGSGVNGCLGHGDFHDAAEVCSPFYFGFLLVYIVVHCSFSLSLISILHLPFTCLNQPRLVQAMLAHQTMEVACGPNHVVAVTAADGKGIPLYMYMYVR